MKLHPVIFSLPCPIPTPVSASLGLLEAERIVDEVLANILGDLEQEVDDEVEGVEELGLPESLQSDADFKDLSEFWANSQLVGPSVDLASAFCRDLGFLQGLH